MSITATTDRANSDSRSGAVFAILTFTLFAVFHVFLRLSREEVSTVMAIWARFAFGGVVLIILCLRRHSVQSLVPRTDGFAHVRRILFGLLSISCFAYAAPQLPVSDSVALQFSIPIMLAVAAKIFLGEELPWVRQLAILFGIVGVLLVAKPTGTGVGSAACIVLLGCVLAACADLQLKILARQFAAEILALYFFLVGALIFTVLLPFSFTMPSNSGAVYLLIMAATGTSAQVCLGIVFQRMSASAVAPFVYTSFIWTVLLDMLIWSNYPDFLGILGAGCIMIDGILAYRSTPGAAREPVLGLNSEV
jgi:drug/metabolite transporter (DMT)-like permease